ncbi:hypothetical protein CR513_52047, partial [Mucuna pruriens]
MKRMFLEMFFPGSRTTSIRKEIYDIRQHSDAVSGGALMDKTTVVARNLIFNTELQTYKQEKHIHLLNNQNTDTCRGFNGKGWSQLPTTIASDSCSVPPMMASLLLATGRYPDTGPTPTRPTRHFLKHHETKRSKAEMEFGIGIRYEVRYVESALQESACGIGIRLLDDRVDIVWLGCFHPHLA